MTSEPFVPAGPYCRYHAVGPPLTGPSTLRVGFTLPDGTPAHVAELRGADAWEVADLQSVLEDLRRVVALCDLWGPAAQLGPVGQTALWEAASVTYGRCFKDGKSARGKGKRARVPDDLIEGLPAHLREEHDVTLRSRDKHIGHRVDAGLEPTRVVGLRRRPEGPIEQIAVSLARVERADLSRLRELAETLAEALWPVVDARMAALRERVNGQSTGDRGVGPG